MATEQVLKEVQESLRTLLEQNKRMNEQIENLQVENEKLKTSRTELEERVRTNVQSMTEANAAAMKVVDDMITINQHLNNDDWMSYDEVAWFFNEARFKDFVSHLTGLSIKQTASSTDELHEDLHPEEKFDNSGREERLDIVFGNDGDLTAKSLRRFIEKYRVVKNLNMTARLVGWDSPEYRANKLKLALQGDAFDYVSFEDSMCREWTKDDEGIIEKLKDRYLNVQAVEVNILKFENSCQEGRELPNEYLARLQQLAKDAYEGQKQSDLDLKIAWKFVSGLSEENVRRKLMEGGWMKNRREAKPLDELLKIAEVTRQTDEAVRATKPGTGSAAMFQQDREGEVSATRFRNVSSDSHSSRASGSSGSSGLVLDFIQCWYCNKKHRGGWFHCEKRKKENPTWRPSSNKKGSKSSTNSQADRSSSSNKDFR